GASGPLVGTRARPPVSLVIGKKTDDLTFIRPTARDGPCQSCLSPDNVSASEPLIGHGRMAGPWPSVALTARAARFAAQFAAKCKKRARAARGLRPLRPSRGH